MFAGRLHDQRGPTEAELSWVGNAHDPACFRRVEKEGFAEDEHEDEDETSER